MWFSITSPFLQRFCSQSIRNFMTSSHSQPTRSILQNVTGTSHLKFTSLKTDNVWSFDSVRTIIRNHFPYPREHKRIRTHGFKKRMSTRGGRAVLMRRILKGRHVLSH